MTYVIGVVALVAWLVVWSATAYMWQCEHESDAVRQMREWDRL